MAPVEFFLKFAVENKHLDYFYSKGCDGQTNDYIRGEIFFIYCNLLHLSAKQIELHNSMLTKKLQAPPPPVGTYTLNLGSGSGSTGSSGEAWKNRSVLIRRLQLHFESDWQGLEI
jgi:hypothetical protein